MSSTPNPTQGVDPVTVTAQPETQTQGKRPEPGTRTWAEAGEEFPACPIPPGFRLVQSLGLGGMGQVFEVVDEQLGSTFALKMAHAGSLSAIARERFRQEAKAMVDLDHPHIARIYAYGEYQDVPYLTMRYLRGGTLAAKCRQQPYDRRSAVAMIRKIVSAMAYLHERGFVHRDLKPHNVLLDDYGEPYVCDFGLVKTVHTNTDTERNAPITVPDKPPVMGVGSDATPELTAPGAILGTRVYMSPEQALGNIAAVGPKSDVWAIGVMLYEMLVGKRPFQHSDPDELTRRILNEDPVPPSEYDATVDATLERITLRCLAKNPDARPTTQELHAQLTAWLAPPLAKPRRPLAIWVLVGAMVAFALLAIGIIVPIINRRLAPTDRPNPNEPELPAVGPTVEAIRQGLRERIAQGEKVVLVDEQGKLRVPLIFLFDRDLIRPLNVGDECVVSYPSLTYAELLDDVGVDHYAMRGEIQCERVGPRGEAGLFVARHIYDSPAFTTHFLVEMRYTEPVPLNVPAKAVAKQGEVINVPAKVAPKGTPGAREAFVRRITINNATSKAATAKHQLDMVQKSIPTDDFPADGWRSIALHAQPNRYLFQWHKTQAATVARPLPFHIEEAITMGVRQPIDRPTMFRKPGSIGLVTQGGTIHFRNVTIERLPPE